ncbi:HAMP domain-containing protein [Herbaspirillum rubrisubalbicans]|uniref:HAMP domain-containing protein n=1 Tax=Herbaspirillum rubrisubalbicans TaxID=80842 RepID=UPI0015EC5A89
MTRSIAAPLHETHTLTLRIAAGDLTASVPVAQGRLPCSTRWATCRNRCARWSASLAKPQCR